jgi:atypical dual specificity phosphatase
MGRTGRAYRRARSYFSDKPTNFGWVIEGSIAASGLPSSKAQVLWLKKHGVSSILTLTEDPLPKDFLEGTGVVSVHVRMMDHKPPSQESLSKAVRQLRSEVEKGNAVVVHCLGGKGRTGSVISAYMVQYQGKDVDGAISQLRKARRGSVERSQESSVREYVRNLKEAKTER